MNAHRISRRRLAGGMAAVVNLHLAVAAAGAAQEFFAMDTGTRDAAHATPAAQVALVSELGFDGFGPAYTTPEALAATLAAADAHRLKVSALYLGIDLDAAGPPGAPVRDAVRQLAGRGTLVWLYLTCNSRKPSDPAGDERAVAVLRETAELAHGAGLRVALYPHAGFWLERVEHAARLAAAAGCANLGVTFNLCHWLMVDGADLDASLAAARPHLFAVTINGADPGATDWTRLIQPLDRGRFDPAELLGRLDALGWSGPVGLQHYGIGGDARANLGRSMAAWRRLRWVDLLPAGGAFGAWEDAAGWREAGEAGVDPADPGRLAVRAGTGVIVSEGAAGYLLTRERFGDVAVHVEFLIPRGSNSGVYFGGSHEVQILDSHGVATPDYPGNECGGIYPEWIGEANVRGHSPAENASRPAGEWQSFDVVYRAPRFDAGGRKTRNARFERVVHNGRLVHRDVEVLGPTRVGLPEAAAGPLRLQGDHGPVAFRELRLRRLVE